MCIQFAFPLLLRVCGWPAKEYDWYSINDYFEQNATDSAKKKYKNWAQKKAYLVRELGVSLQYDRGPNTCAAIVTLPPSTTVALFFSIYEGISRCLSKCAFIAPYCIPTVSLPWHFHC